MHFLSISAIFKQENPWLNEWLEYHIARGVEHFYLYNNDDDTTESDAILEPYVRNGIVNNIHAPGRAIQMQCMADAITQFINETHWLACIDLDEFILPRQCDDIRSVLQDYELYSGLCINWATFGANNFSKRPTNQIDYLLRRAFNTRPINSHVKSIVKPKMVNACIINTPHYFHYDIGHAVNEHYQIVESSFSDYSDDVIRINHYIVRSLQDTKEIKIPRQRADCLLEREPDFFDIYNYNDIYDDEISRRFGQMASRCNVE